MRRAPRAPVLPAARRAGTVVREVLMLRTPIARLRVIGWCEAVSFLVLLGIAVPLKHLAGMPRAVTVCGWIHGVWFVLYVIALVAAARAHGWSLGRAALLLLAAVVPCGPFIADRRLRDADTTAP